MLTFAVASAKLVCYCNDVRYNGSTHNGRRCGTL